MVGCGVIGFIEGVNDGEDEAGKAVGEIVNGFDGTMEGDDDAGATVGYEVGGGVIGATCGGNDTGLVVGYLVGTGADVATDGPAVEAGMIVKFEDVNVGALVMAVGGADGVCFMADGAGVITGIFVMVAYVGGAVGGTLAADGAGVAAVGEPVMTTTGVGDGVAAEGPGVAAGRMVKTVPAAVGWLVIASEGGCVGGIMGMIECDEPIIVGELVTGRGEAYKFGGGTGGNVGSGTGVAK